jgi:hypothetical protein
VKWSKITLGGNFDGPLRATITEQDPDLPDSPLREAVVKLYDAMHPKREIFADGTEKVQPHWLGELLVTVRCQRCRRRIAWVIGAVYARKWLEANPGTHPSLLYVAEVRSAPPQDWLERKDDVRERRVPVAITLVRDLLDFVPPEGTAGHPPLRVGCGKHPGGVMDRDEVLTAARRAQADGKERVLQFRSV